MLADARLRDLIGVSFLFAVVQLAFAGFMVLTLRTAAEISLSEAGLVMAYTYAAAIAGRVFWGWLADRLSRAAPVLVGLGLLMGLACLGFALLRPGLPLSLLVGLGMLVGASSTGWNGVYLAELARLAGARSAASVTGAALVVTYIGSLVGPLLFGAMIWLAGTQTAAFGVLGALTIIAMLAWSLARRPDRMPPTTHR